MFAFIPFVTILIITSFFLILRKRSAPRRFIRIGRKIHIGFIGGYIALLCIGLIFAEIAEVKNREEMPKKLDNDQLSIYFEQVVQKKGRIDTSYILSERQYTVSESLSIHQPFEHVAFYIERTKDHSTVKEVIYKPLLDINHYDFSDHVKVEMPIWQDNEVTIPKQPKSIFRYISYHDSALVNQLTTARGANFNGFSSGYQTMAIHLIVPEDVDIQFDSTDYVTFINE